MKNFIYITLIILSINLFSCSKSLTLSQSEKEKLIEGHWTNEFKYADFQFLKKNKGNEYLITWPGTEVDTGTWKIAGNGIELKSNVTGEVLYGDIVKLDEDNLTVFFVNRKEFELFRVED